MEKAKQVVVSESKQRLDDFVAAHFSITRSQSKKLIEQKMVLLNDEVVSKAGSLVKNGDCVVVTLPDKIQPSLASDLPLSIVFENANLLIVDKPAGIVTHPDAHYQSDSLVQRVLAHTALSSIGLPERPGVVHRLDKDTSGLVIFAKNDAAHLALTKIFADRKIAKYYVALVHGGSKLPDSGTINSPIDRNPRDRKKMDVSASDKARHALSHFTVLQRFPQATLVEVKIETGRTHQIRVHFSAINHPVVGDVTYGNSKLDRQLEKILEHKIPRMILHAQRLQFVLPGEQEAREFVAEAPPDIASFLA